MASKGHKVARNPLAEFGKAIQNARIAKGWTLKKLGFEALGRDKAQGYVSQIEYGKRRITPLTAGKFAKALGLPVSVIEPLRAAAPEVDEITEQDTSAETLIEASAQEAAGSPVSDALLVALAYEYAPTTTGDLKSAYAGLRQALAEAAALKARAALPQNTSDAVQAVLQRVAELNKLGQLDAAQSELDDALDRLQAQRATLLDQAASQARLRNDPATAARHMVDRLRIDAPDKLFDALRALRRHHYDIGLRQGIGFDLALSVHLARHSHRIATTDLQRGTALNDLAIALQDQGTRAAGQAGTDLLAQAVAAYRDALTVFTPADHPVQWAMTMQNLAVALQNQGTRTAGQAGTDLLAQAVTAYRDALTVRTPADHPVDWAGTMQNLAAALETQGTRTEGKAGTDLLAQAIAAYRDALTVFTPADHPVDWAGTMQNLAGALQTEGARTAGQAGTDLLAQAVAAYRDALTVFTPADHPVQWAITQENMARCELARAQHPACDDPLPHLRAALAHVDAALTVYDPVHMPHDHGTATALRARILAALGP